MMRYPGDVCSLLSVLSFIHTYSYVYCQTNSTTTQEDANFSANNVIWMIVGVVCGVVVVLIAVIGGCVAVYYHTNKRVHPHSDTDTIYTESETYTRPTTASHIHFDTEDEAMSKPVPMTPFELRKLYVETFPFTKWKKSYDGHLRPHMGLSFVDPRLYARSKNDERSFRKQIFSFEMSDSMTVRSNTVSRLTRPVITAMSNLEPVTEVPSNSDGDQQPSTSRSSHYKTCGDHSEVRQSVLQGDDVEL